jgi:hypothetical protein
MLADAPRNVSKVLAEFHHVLWNAKAWPNWKKRLEIEIVLIYWLSGLRPVDGVLDPIRVLRRSEGLTLWRRAVLARPVGIARLCALFEDLSLRIC